MLPSKSLVSNWFQARYKLVTSCINASYPSGLTPQSFTAGFQLFVLYPLQLLGGGLDLCLVFGSNIHRIEGRSTGGWCGSRRVVVIALSRTAEASLELGRA